MHELVQLIEQSQMKHGRIHRMRQLATFLLHVLLLRVFV